MTAHPAAALGAPYTPPVARPLPRPFFPSEPRSEWGRLYVLVRRAGAAGVPEADVPAELGVAVAPLVAAGVLAWDARGVVAVLVRATLLNPNGGDDA